MKRKVCVVITARPSYSRIKTALEAIKNDPNMELQIVVTASANLDRYGNAIKYIEADGFEIAAKVFTVLEGENLVTMVKSAGLGLLELPSVFERLKPDFVITIADRYETIATAISAAYMNIPLIHIQGGEITGSIDEKVRHAVTKLSNFHLVSTKKAQERVHKMGEAKESIFTTGCPSIDIAREVLARPRMDFDVFKKYGGVGEVLDTSQGYIVVMQHPVTLEHELSRIHINETLEAINEAQIPTFWFWPNVDAGSDGTSKGIRVFREAVKPKHIHFFKNMTGSDFLRVLVNSKGIVGNSSVAIRECSFLGVPAINVGSRQSHRERGANVVDVGYSKGEILSAIKEHFSKGSFPSDNLYGDGYAGQKIANVIKALPLGQVEKYLIY